MANPFRADNATFLLTLVWPKVLIRIGDSAMPMCLIKTLETQVNDARGRRSQSVCLGQIWASLRVLLHQLLTGIA